MNKAQAIDTFWKSFGIPAYEQTTVNDENTGDFYITYEVVTDSLDRAVPMSASIWQKHTASWEAVTLKAEEISNALKQVKSIPLDTGFLYITRGQPFAQHVADEDETTRRIYINVMAEFLAP